MNYFNIMNIITDCRLTVGNHTGNAFIHQFCASPSKTGGQRMFSCFS